ncbi:alpha/beta hydrolase family protein [Nonomuraea dietziae]|uniref:alpha/beta hydrolase family protein n=1 Tax=Nonomuraea dietziae TaxID=65515 RepID=UPI003426DB2D
MPTSTPGLRARRTGVKAMGLALAAVATLTAAPAAAEPSAVRLRLPAPTGGSPIGVTDLHLVDRSRPDPWVAARPYRELMVSVWYPAGGSPRLPLAPQMAPLAAADFDDTLAPALFGTKPGTVDWAATTTHARADAPVDRRAGRVPVVLFSAGAGAPRTIGATLVEELASRGYAVVTVDHTYEAAQVEFPGGRLERSAFPQRPTQEDMAKAQRVREEDMRFVLDQLARLGRGDNPDAERRRLPAGLRGGLDLTRVGALGHSMGGATAAQLTHGDRRVDAGVNLDGGFRGSVATTGVAKPFLQIAAENHTRASDPSWKSFWDRSTGWKRELRFTGTAHYSFSDAEAVVPQLAGELGVPAGDIIGTVDPRRAVTAQRAYVSAFFDLHLKGRRTTLFDGLSSRFPEVKPIP